MIDFAPLVKETRAYSLLNRQMLSNRISHAYLIESADGEFLLDYLKVFAKAIMKGNADGFDRDSKLIDNNSHPDVIILPREEGDVKTEDINFLIEESYIKPIEGEKKLFIINHAESMTISAQNKLLKTLEEPPKNVYILLGTTSSFPILSTVKSRVEKLEMTAFSNDKIFDALKNQYTDLDKLNSAVCCGDGTLSGAIKLYNDKKLSTLINLAVDLICNMQSSKDVLEYSLKISQEKEVDQFFSVLEVLFKDLLSYYSDNENLIKNKSAFEKIKKAKGYNLGSVIYILEKLTERNKREMANNNEKMLLDWTLFAILEGKFKWQKS